MRHRAAATAVMLTAAAVLVVLAFTMGPRSDGIVRTLAAALVPSGSAAERLAMGAAVEMALNVALFVPLGIGLGVAVRSKVLATVLGALLSAGVELGQSTALIDRTPSSRDVLMNSLGAALGVLAVSSLLLLARWARRRRAVVAVQAIPLPAAA